MRNDTSQSVLDAAREVHESAEFHAVLAGEQMPDARESALVLSIVREAKRQVSGPLTIAQLTHLGQYARSKAGKFGLDAQKRIVEQDLRSFL